VILSLGHGHVNQLILRFENLVTRGKGVGKHALIDLYAPRLKVERALCTTVRYDKFAKRLHSVNFDHDAGLSGDLTIISVSFDRG